MIAALMAMVGATATEAREAQQVAGLFSLPIFMPLWFITVIIEHPDCLWLSDLACSPSPPR